MKGIAIAIVATMIVLIVVPLGYHEPRRLPHERRREPSGECDQGSGWPAAATGLSRQRYEDDRVVIVVRGSGTPPSEQALADRLKGQLFGMPVQLEMVPAQIADFETK